NGVGLDTPESAIRILQSLESAGYDLGKGIPKNVDDLIERISQNVTNEEDISAYKPAEVAIDEAEFYRFYNSLALSLRKKIEEQWGHPENAPNHRDGKFLLPGFCCGNVFVTLQPSRGYNVDLKATYHSPDLPPTFDYLAFYCWIENEFQADAVIHTGKHGNLEWLPGKSVGLDDETCFPAAAFNELPHFYPFIINDPGEGAQAKRRNQAVILDHMIPPMTRAETYGPLLKLEQLIDEYYQAATQDPKRVKLLKQKILDLVKEADLDKDLEQYTDDVDELLNAVDGYLCELKEAQIRGGLHIFGQAPEKDKLIDLLISLHRLPSGNTAGITSALAEDLKLGFDPLNCDYKTPFEKEVNGVFCKNYGDVVEQLELYARNALKERLDGNEEGNNHHLKDKPCFEQVIETILNDTLNNKVLKCEDEIGNLLEGLKGGYIPSGGSGAPTRGMVDILPTGRNFYLVDIRTVPTKSACELGKKSADELIERYLQENGDYPETIAIS
ncbi:MAG: cobaltochelatase subunit CobN, partial [Flavobacteriales bacterium]